MPNPSAPTIRLYVLGDARIETGRATIEPDSEVAFACALYLLLERKHNVSRRLLERLLWPDADKATASHRLRQTMLKLRQLGLPIIASGKTTISISGCELLADYEAITANTSDAIRNAVIPRPLPGYEPLLSSDYLRWLDDKRDEIGASLTRFLLALISKARAGGHWADVEAHAKSILHYSPLNEEAILALAEGLAMRGQKIEGVQILDRYLAEIGAGSSDLRIPASVMRRRIADRMPSHPAQYSGDMPLIGRAIQMEILAGLLSDIRTGRGKSCFIWGDAGIGKTRLANEFLSFASLQGARCQRVHCRASDQHRSLSALLDLIPLLRGMKGAIGSAPETLEFFERLTKHQPRDNALAEIAPMAGPTNSQLEYALSDTLDAVSDESPIVLAIEDSHWLDAASANVLSGIASRIANRRILLLFTSRRSPQESSLLLPEVRSEVFVSPLSDSEATTLMLEIVRQKEHDIGSTYLGWCVRVAEGNPYFLQELCTHWIETGEEYVAPPSLTAVLKHRLARLSAPALQLLQTCALLENHSSIHNLESTLGQSPHNLLASINELATSGMATIGSSDRRTDGVARLTSRHDLLSDTALLQLAPPARAYLHRRAAVVLESLIVDDPDASTLWSCAKHWQLAGEGANAFRLARSCAFHLLDAGLPTDAYDAFERAQAYCSTGKELLAVLEGQVTAAYRCSAWQHVIDVASAVRGLQSKLQSNSGGHDDLELMVLRAEWQTLNWDLTLDKSLKCLSAEEASPAHRVEAGIMALMLLSHSGDLGRSASTFKTISDLSSAAGVPSESILKAKMVYHTNWGSLDDAIGAARTLVCQMKSKADVGELFRSLCNAGVTFRVAGLFEEARQSLQEALDLAESHHLNLAKLRVIPMLANLALELGKTDEVRRWHTELVGMTIGSEDKFSQLESLAIGARIALLDRNPKQAMALIEPQSQRIMTDPIQHRRTYNAALWVAAEVGVHGHALQPTLELLESSYMRSRTNLYQGFATFVLMRGLQTVGRGDEANQLLDEYVSVYRREAWPPGMHLMESLRLLSPSD
jgi:DNA-binding SARP family transcriptional activator/tetratricopeptide (TPR) repeat protein